MATRGRKLVTLSSADRRV
jgi:hypothetical protein